MATVALSVAVLALVVGTTALIFSWIFSAPPPNDPDKDEDF
jgi:hypothetical protein